MILLRNLIFFIFSVFFSGVFGSLCAQTQADWQTHYEKSGHLETPRYPATIDYCQRLDAASEWVKYESFGKSPQGRDLPLVIVDKNGNFTPEAVRKSGNVIMLAQSCIHSGESDGKDASLMLMRELVITRDLADLLDHVTILFIPIFNVDGHEMFGPYNRLNQNGPTEMGFRATAQNYNLNRDFLKAESPEMQAWLKLYNRWLPDFLADNHVTNGADHQYVMTYGIETNVNVAAPLREWTTDVMEPYLVEAMSKDNQLTAPYFSMNRRPAIGNGVKIEPYSPRYSTGYGAVQNRIFYLVETHALKDYKTRVTANYLLMKHMLALLNKERKSLLSANRTSDALTRELPGSYLPLDLTMDMTDTTMAPFAGIEYEETFSEISNSERVVYNGKPVTMEIPYFKKSVVTDSAKIPYAYIIPPQWVLQIDRLGWHDVKIHRLSEAISLEVDSYRFNNASWRRQSFEGQLMTEFSVTPLTETRMYPQGSAVIIMNQRTNRVIAHLLEPHAPDSYVKWGYWNTLFERKEYGEDYVLETIAREMLAENPELQKEFDQYLADNPGAAQNRWARLYFFYARTPYWENRINLYPVGKIMTEQSLPLDGIDGK